MAVGIINLIVVVYWWRVVTQLQLVGYVGLDLSCISGWYMLWYGYECWSIGVTLMESILNQQQTIHTQSAAVRVVQKDMWYGVVIILWVGIIHNNISIVEVSLYLLQRF